MLLKNGRYTTCPCQKDEEPEFYLNMSRVKIIPDKVIVAGPSNLVLKGIPTPLFIPFGIFPRTIHNILVVLPLNARDNTDNHCILMIFPVKLWGIHEIP